MVSTIGYILISVLLLVFAIIVMRVLMDTLKSDPESIPLGPLAKEISDIILDNTRKFITLQDDTMLSYVTAGLLLVIIILVKIIFI